MKDTGIIRRVDDLGRIVIPKELRKVLRIKQGDLLEIFTSDEQMVLKKYSPVQTVLTKIKVVADCISQTLKKPCVVTDNDEVLYTSGINSKEFIGKGISVALNKILDERKNLNACRSDGAETVPIYIGDVNDYQCQFICPITNNGDCFGAIIVFSLDNKGIISQDDIKAVSLGVSFITKSID